MTSRRSGIDWPVVAAFTCVACMFVMNQTPQHLRLYVGAILIGAWVALGIYLFMPKGKGRA